MKTTYYKLSLFILCFLFSLITMSCSQQQYVVIEKVKYEYWSRPAFSIFDQPYYELKTDYKFVCYRIENGVVDSTKIEIKIIESKTFELVKIGEIIFY